MDSKECSKCSETKELSLFNKDKGKKLGVTSKCRACSNAASRKFREENPDAKKLWDKDNANHIKDYCKNRSITHREQHIASTKQWREANPTWNSEYRKANLKRYAAHSAKRRASKLQRTPVWSETLRIQEFYEACPDGHHVDHRIPLQGEAVSGLHVIGNLQYLLAEENLSKSNKF